jgi:hypothetical protein
MNCELDDELAEFAARYDLEVRRESRYRAPGCDAAAGDSR